MRVWFQDFHLSFHSTKICSLDIKVAGHWYNIENNGRSLIFFIQISNIRLLRTSSILASGDFSNWAVTMKLNFARE